MPVIRVTEEQVIDLLKQLSPSEQEAALRYLVRQWWPRWDALSQYGQDQVRVLARERGLDWDSLGEEEREAFIDDLLHEAD